MASECLMRKWVAPEMHFTSVLLRPRGLVAEGERMMPVVVVLSALGDGDEEGIVEVAGHEEARAGPDSNLMEKGPGRGACLKPCSEREAIKSWCRVPDVREVGANAGR